MDADSVKHPTVLVVEDDQNMRIYLCNLLRSDGYRPIDAPDGPSGYRKAIKEKPDLIVLDGMLPAEGSSALYTMIKSDPALAQTPVVMLATVDYHTFCYYRRCQRTQGLQDVPDPEAFVTAPMEAEDFLGIVRRHTRFDPSWTGGKGVP